MVRHLGHAWAVQTHVSYGAARTRLPALPPWRGLSDWYSLLDKHLGAATIFFSNGAYGVLSRARIRCTLSKLYSDCNVLVESLHPTGTHWCLTCDRLHRLDCFSDALRPIGPFTAISAMEGSLSNDGVLEQHIPWESYKMNGQISDRDFTLIKKYDKSPETVKASELDEVCVATEQTKTVSHRCLHERERM